MSDTNEPSQPERLPPPPLSTAKRKIKIPIKKYAMDESLSWEGRYHQLDKHHQEETGFLISWAEQLDLDALVIDEVKTAHAGQCSCTTANCIHDQIRDIAARSIDRQLENTKLLDLGLDLLKLRKGQCLGQIAGTFVNCGEGGNYCSTACNLRVCLKEALDVGLRTLAILGGTDRHEAIHELADRLEAQAKQL